MPVIIFERGAVDGMHGIPSSDLSRRLHVRQACWRQHGSAVWLGRSRQWLLAAMAVVAWPTSLQSQGYRPLLQPYAYWQDAFGWGSLGPNTSSSECYRYFLDGDSLVNGVSYWILRLSGSAHLNNSVHSSLSYTYWYNGTFVALLREDSVARRVHILKPGWLNEMLLYDFSASVGPYPPTYRFNGLALTVTSVDTVQLADGPHRRLNFGAGGYLRIIEGVGCTTGFLPGVFGGEINFYRALNCQGINGVPVYERTDQVWMCPCDMHPGMPESPGPLLHIGPSPTDGICWVRGSAPGAHYVLCATDGRIVGTGKIGPDGAAAIDMAAHPAGLYFLVIHGHGETASAARIMRE